MAIESSTSEFEIDVFLSFRGDTRKNFTDHLFRALKDRGIHTFRDDEELRKGEYIRPGLEDAIKKSRFAVVIFSREYATSKWCLGELACILKCMEERGQKVLPVFYHVEPTDVRNQTGLYKKAFDDYRQVFTDQEGRRKVGVWETALNKIGHLDGWAVKDRYESVVIQEIAIEISNAINYSFVSVKMDLIGMKTRIEKVLSYLDMKLSSSEVRTIGICGMEGIGKTTIVQQVFKKISREYEACCFISDIKEESKRNHPIYLQNFLFKYLLGNEAKIQYVDEGIALLRKRSRFKKVLIVLDDVDELKQLEALVGNNKGHELFGLGSRVIITTRDEDLLRTYGVENTNVHVVDKLTDDEARQLLCQKANIPPNNGNYKEICDNIIQYARGLPLALEILSSFLLSDKKVREWSATIIKLEQNLSEKFLVTVEGYREDDLFCR